MKTEDFINIFNGLRQFITMPRYNSHGNLGLKYLDIGNFDTSNVTDMWGMFYHAESLETLDLSNFNTENVLLMSGMFNGCKSLKKLDIGSFNTEKIEESLYYMLNCDNLEEITTPKVMGSYSIPLPKDFVDEMNNVYNKITQDSAGKKLVIKSASSDLLENENIVLANAVKFVPYVPVDLKCGSNWTINTELPAGMNLSEEGILSGIPTVAGNYSFTVNTTPTETEIGKMLTYNLTILDNTNENIASETDAGYEITQPVGDFMSGVETEQTLVSIGDFGEFQEVYIDAVKLTPVEDYTAEEGSTRITIKSQTFARFNQPGTHTIVMKFQRTDTSEIKYAVQNYVVNSAETSDDKAGNEGTSDILDSSSNVNAENDSNQSSSQISVNVSTESTGEPINYTIQRGDTLSRIARNNGITLSQLLAWNPQITNPNLIYPDQKIVVSYTNSTPTENTPADAVYDMVQRGDSLYLIARRNKVPLSVVMTLNPALAKQKYIYPGQKVRIK